MSSCLWLSQITFTSRTHSLCGWNMIPAASCLGWRGSRRLLLPLGRGLSGGRHFFSIYATTAFFSFFSLFPTCLLLLLLPLLWLFGPPCLLGSASSRALLAPSPAAAAAAAISMAMAWRISCTADHLEGQLCHEARECPTSADL